MELWTEYNPNPAGKSVGDCAVRAVSAALGVDWDTAYLLMAIQGFVDKDMPSSNSVWGTVLRQNGFNRYGIPNSCPDCYTFADFAGDHKNGIYVLGTGSHTATIKSGQLLDSWNSLKEVPQYFWVKED